MFRKYIKPYRKEFILAPSFKFLEAVMELLVPLTIAYLIDHAIPNTDVSAVFLGVFSLVLIAIASIVIALLAQYFSSKAAIGTSKEITKDLYRKLIRLQKIDRSDWSNSQMVNYLTGDMLTIQTGINLFLRLFLRSPIIVVGSVIMASTISLKMTLIFLAVVFSLIAIVLIISKFLNLFYKKIRNRIDEMTSSVSQQYQGMRVIRAFDQSATEVDEFEELNHKHFQDQLKAGRLAAFLSPLTFVVVNLGLVAIIYLGYGEIQIGNLSQGMVVALINYMNQILAALLATSLLLTSLNQSIVAYSRVSSVLHLEENASEQLESIETNALVAIEANGLTFTYPNATRPALEDLHFQIEDGSSLGVIGGTGAGKSTLVKVLSALYPSDVKELKVSHNSRTASSVTQWHDWVSLVPQKAQLFEGTIASNLKIGLSREVSEEDLWWALEIAQASDFIREKGGLEATVQAFGRNFSGGQRQRLTIARAVLRKAPFLILDDATSALDALTEKALINKIQTELSHKTLIIVSQRMSLMSQVDQILVLDKGKQIGLGSHEDLIKDNEIYQEIYHSQGGRIH